MTNLELMQQVCEEINWMQDGKGSCFGDTMDIREALDRAALRAGVHVFMNKDGYLRATEDF